MALVGNFNGIDEVFGGHPPDLEIAAGPTNLVLSSNDSVVILTKAGVLLAVASLREFFGSVRTKVGPFEGDADFLADVSITFDPWSQRFFMAVASGFESAPDCPSGPCEFHMLLAVSKDANPSSTTSADWHFYALEITSEEAGIVGIDRTVVRSSEGFIVVTAGIEPFPGKPGGILTRVLPKSKIVRGEPVDRDDWVDIRGIHASLVAIGGGGFLPAQHLDRPPNDTFFMIGYHGDCSLTVIGIDDALVAPAIAYQVVQPTGPAQECAFGPTNPPQPGGPSLAVVNVSGSQGYSVVFRNGSLWAVQFIEGENFGATAIRWVQIDVSDWPAPPRMVQDSVFGTEGAWHTFPAFAVDSSNNMAMVYGRSSDTEFPSAYYTGRLASDPLNTLRPGTLFKAGGASLDSGSLVGRVDGAERYGDYFGAAIDPVDGTVWLLGQYVKAPACWGSWVAHVSFESSTISAGLTSGPTAAREPQTTCPREGFGTPPAGHFEVRFETAITPGILSIGPGDAAAYRFRVIGFDLRSLSPSEREQAVETPLASPWYYDGSTNLYVFLESGAPPGDYALVIHLPDGGEARAAFAYPSPTSAPALQLLGVERVLVSENFGEGVDRGAWDLVGSAGYGVVEGGVLLTRPLNGQLGYLFSKQRINTQRFNVSFSFSTVAGSRGEGFAFVLSRGIPTEADAQRATGGGAFGLDVLDGIAIEFDIRPGDRGDESVEHVGLDVMPSGDVLAAQDVTFSLRDNGFFDVEIAFDSGHVRVDVGNPSIGLARTRVLDYVISDFVPFDGYFGFVGATGDGTDAHVIHDVIFDGLTESTSFATATPTGPSSSPAPD